MPYETVDLKIENGVAEITLNRPERLNAWTAQFGDELREAILTDAAAPEVRAVLITGAGRGFSSGADLKEMLEQRAAGARGAGRGRHAAQPLPPDHQGDQGAAEAGRRGGQRPGGRDRLLAGAGRRPDLGRRVGGVRPRVREHRPGAGRRLDLPRAGRGRQGEGARDGPAGRPDPGREGPRLGPDQPRRAGRRPDERGARAGRRGWPRGRPAPTPSPSGPSTTPCSRSWTSSSIWRPTSRARW